MKGIILAAGRGSRLGSITDERPKCLVPVAGRALLDWQIEALRGGGVERVGVVTGYNREQISRPGIETFWNARWAETNMVASLRCAHEWLERGPCVVSYSDIIYPPTVVAALIGAATDITITYDQNWLALWQKRFDDPLSDAETFRLDADGGLVEIGNRPRTTDEVQGQYMGLLYFTPAGWNQVCRYLDGVDATKRDRLDMTSLLRGLLEGGTPVGTVAITEPWFEVDNAHDLAVAEAALRPAAP